MLRGNEGMNYPFKDHSTYQDDSGSLCSSSSTFGSCCRPLTHFVSDLLARLERGFPGQEAMTTIEFCEKNTKNQRAALSSGNNIAVQSGYSFFSWTHLVDISKAHGWDVCPAILKGCNENSSPSKARWMPVGPSFASETALLPHGSTRHRSPLGIAGLYFAVGASGF